MSHIKILWVQDEYDGPMNGLAEYNGRNVWFSRLNTPSIISPRISKIFPAEETMSPLPTEIPIPYTNVEISEEQSATDRSYLLHRLTENDMKLVIENHQDHCHETGAPVKHGDPHQIRIRPQITRMDAEVAFASIPKDETVLKVSQRPLGCVKQYVHKIVPGGIKGEFVAIVKESEFMNYNVPHTVSVVDI
jgi:hypothetical protein